VLEAAREAGVHDMFGEPGGCAADLASALAIRLAAARARAAVHLLDDVFTCGDLLRGINRRQELCEHDGALIAALARSPDAETGGWFARLDALFGLDDDLDRLLERTRAVQGDAAALDRLVPEVLVRLAQVQ
jgi:hypothetical protein